MKIAFVGGFRDFEPGARTDEERWARALERRGAAVVRIEFPDREWRRQAAAAGPDWLLLSKCKGLTLGDIAWLRERLPRTRIAQVLFDLMDYEERRFPRLPWPLRNRLTWWLPIARRLDVVFHREFGHAERYRAAGVNGVYLDQGADAEDTPAEGPTPELACDLAFFGRHSTGRSAVLRRLGADLRVRIYSSLPERWRRDGFEVAPAVYGPRLAAAVRSASVVYGESATHRVAGYWSDRVYRVLGLEGFFVTRYTPGLETFFRNGEHLVWFRRDEELVPLVRRWLEDPEGRQRVAREGRRHVLAHHTYEHRAAEMLSHLEKLDAR